MSPASFPFHACTSIIPWLLSTIAEIRAKYVHAQPTSSPYSLYAPGRISQAAARQPARPITQVICRPMSEIGLFSIVRCQPALSLSPLSLSLSPMAISFAAAPFVRGLARPARLMPIIIITVASPRSAVCPDGRGRLPRSLLRCGWRETRGIIFLPPLLLQHQHQDDGRWSLPPSMSIAVEQCSPFVHTNTAAFCSRTSVRASIGACLPACPSACPPG